MSDNKETKQALDTSLACMMPTMQFPRQPVEQAPAVEAWSEACASCATPRACQYDGCRHDETQAQEPIDYDRVVQICEAHGIGLPVDCVEMVVEIIRLAAPQPATVSAGWKLLPPKMTDEMKDAWIMAPSHDEGYRAMIAAAPQPASKQQHKCTCGNSLGHTRSCPAFNESMMRYEPFGGTSEQQAARELIARNRGLILAVALVAIQGRKDLYAAEARHSGYDDYMRHAGYKECVAAIKALQEGREIVTNNCEIAPLLTFARQIARVSSEEWEQVIRVTLITDAAKGD